MTDEAKEAALLDLEAALWHLHYTTHTHWTRWGGFLRIITPLLQSSRRLWQSDAEWRIRLVPLANALAEHFPFMYDDDAPL
jgi:hypothetical protein